MVPVLAVTVWLEVGVELVGDACEIGILVAFVVQPQHPDAGAVGDPSFKGEARSSIYLTGNSLGAMPRRVPEMLRHGIRVGFGQDCVLDPWYSLGTGDMLDVAFMALHVAQMTSPADMRRCFDMVTTESAAIMGLEGYGLEKGKRASLVVLNAGDPVEAIRLRAERLLVVANGRVVARRAPSPMQLSLEGRPASVDRRFRP